MTFESVQELFSKTVEKYGDHFAIEYGDRRITYGALEERSNILANLLIAGGAQKGSVVAIQSADISETITAVIATLKAGCAFMPLDPTFPEKRLQAMIGEVAPAWFITETKFLESLDRAVRDQPAAGAKVICLDEVSSTSQDRPNLTVIDGLSHRDTNKPNVKSEPNDFAYIYFTSGSTGRPKGIMGRLKAIDHFIKWEIKTLAIGVGARVSQLTNPAFDAFLRDVFVPLCSGGLICIPGDRAVVMMSDSLRDWINAERINIVHCVPSVLRSLINCGLTPEDFTQLKYVLLAGEPLLTSDVAKWTDVFGERVQLVNLYGPTETTMTKFFYFVTPVDRERRMIPIGKPMEGARALIVDERGKPCSPGSVGEIYIRTPFRSLGYYGRAEATNEVFIPNPFTDDPLDLIYKTGDLGRVNKDGNFEFLGRRDQQVKVRGIRVELSEVENLLRAHSAVEDAAVVDREDEHLMKYLCAYVVLREQIPPSVLRDYLAAELPEFSIPSMFVVVDELPRTPNGKIDRRALPAPNRSGLIKGDPVAPRTLVELRLVQIWESLLNISPVGVTDNFFDLGGHSFLAIVLLNRIHKAFDRSLPLASLLRNATIESLAQIISDEAGLPGARTLVEIQPLGSRPPFFCVHSSSGDVLRFVNLTRYLGMDQPFYSFLARGLKSHHEEPFSRIEDMAAHYVQVAQELQPEGPYRLGGWSFGGLVAYEMAQQLRQRNQEVSLLAMFDAHTWGTNRRQDKTDAELSAYLLAGVVENLEMPYEQFKQLDPDEQIDTLLAQIEKTTPMHSEFARQQARTYVKVSQTNMRILGDYIPAPYEGKITVFCTDTTKEFSQYAQDPTLGWGQLTKAVEIFHVPGTHNTMMNLPHAETLAGLLGDCLNRLNGE
jgi:amino acid adenylation domain-containing protein